MKMTQYPVNEFKNQLILNQSNDNLPPDKFPEKNLIISVQSSY